MVRHVVEVDGHSLSFQELYTFYSYLSELSRSVDCRQLLILTRGLVLRYIRRSYYLVYTALLIWFVNLRGNDLIETNRLSGLLAYR